MHGRTSLLNTDSQYCRSASMASRVYECLTVCALTPPMHSFHGSFSKSSPTLFLLRSAMVRAATGDERDLLHTLERSSNSYNTLLWYAIQMKFWQRPRDCSGVRLARYRTLSEQFIREIQPKLDAGPTVLSREDESFVFAWMFQAWRFLGLEYPTLTWEQVARHAPLKINITTALPGYPGHNTDWILMAQSQQRPAIALVMFFDSFDEATAMLEAGQLRMAYARAQRQT